MALRGKSKTICILLTLTMLFMLWPGVAWAEGEDTTPPAFDGDSPREGTALADGSRAVRVIFETQDNEQVYYYLVLLLEGAGEPSNEQVKNGQDANGDPAIEFKTNYGGSKTSNSSMAIGAPQHSTSYDIYMVLSDEAGNLSDPAKVDVTTPPAADLFFEGYPDTGAAQGLASKEIEILVKIQVPSLGTGQVHYVLVERDASPPSVDQVIAGKNSTGADALDTGTITCYNNNQKDFIVTGNDDATDYDLFLVARDTGTAPAPCTEVVKLKVTTPPATATAVCQISTVPATPYTSLGDALNNVEDGQTITLLQNINHNTDDPADVITIDSKTVTFNLAGYTLNVGSSSANQAIVVKNGGKLELFGDSGELNVTASGIAVQAEREGSSAVVTSATSRDSCAVYASFGGEITVQGDAEGKTSGAYAVGAPYMISKITVGRDAKSTGDYSAAAQVKSGGQVTVNGNAIATGDDSKGVSAELNGSKMHVKGNAQGEEYGVYASLSAEVIVDKDVIGATYGVEARTKSKVTVKGDVFASGGIGVFAMSNAQNTPTEVTIDGAITGRDAEYIKLDGVAKAAADKTIPSTKPGYHTYTQTNSEYNYTSTVWVRDPSAPIGEAVWNYRSPLPSPNLIEDIQYVNGRYMAVGYNGTLLTSADGISWQKVSIGADIDRLGGIAYGGGKYVLVGHVNEIAGRIYTSDDGVTWQETAAIPYQWLHDVAYGNGKFVAVGSAGKILTSSDGETWTTHNVTYPDGESTTLLSITYSDIDGRFAAAGMGSDTGQHKGGILTSDDGENWTVTYSNSANTLWDVTCGNGIYVAVGGQSSSSSSAPYFIATSSDGMNWTQASSGSSAYGVLYSADWNGTQFIAAGRTALGGSALVAVSANGTSWTDRTSSGLPGFRVAAASGTRIVAMGSYGNIYTSDDVGSNWTYRTLGATKTLKDVAYNGSNLYVAVGLGGTIQTSPDGQTWTIQNSNTNIDLNKVDYLNNQFIAVGKSGTILTSTDGTTWTARTSGVTQELKGLAYGGGKYVVVGGDSSSNPVILTSSDGMLWSSDNTADLIPRSLVAVAYGDDSFLAVMQYGQSYKYQIDTDTGEFIHTRVTDLAGSGCYPTDIIYDGGKFVAVGGYGEVYLSSDKGDNWTKIDTDLDSYSQGLAYGGGNFVAVGELGKIMASADGGTTWFLQPSGLPHNHYSYDNHTRLNGIVAGDDCFVAVGEDGIVLQSASFTVSADADANDVEVAQRPLYADNILGSGLNSSERYIIANMNLMTNWNKETAITWSSSKPATIANNGTVVRPAFGDGDKVVNLTATISKGSASAVKTFIVVVKAQPDPDISIVEQAVNALTFDVIKGSNTHTSNITSDLNLIADGGNGTSISWSSNKPATIAADGTVTRPAEGASDESVTLTATISKGTVTRTRTFYLTVKALVDTDAQDVADAKAALIFDTIKGSNTVADNIVSNLSLTTSGTNGTIINWASDKPGYIAVDGTVTRPAQGAADEVVTLTATITKGTASDTKAFTLTVSASPSSGGRRSSAPSGIVVTPTGKDAANTDVNLSFPAGAVEDDIRVQVRDAALTSGISLPADSQLISKVVDIVKDRPGNFSQPVTITMSFNRSQIDPDKYDIKIYYFDEEKGEWVELDNIQVNLNQSTVSGQVNHFTKFAVIATPKPDEPPKLPADVAGHWASESIAQLVKAGIVSGYPDGSFQPDKTVTRAEFTVMLLKALKLEQKAGPIFKDTAAHWAKDTIASAAAYGLVKGYDKNSFGPDDLITREQAAVMIAGAAKLEAAQEELEFTDAGQISAWAESAVAAAVKGNYLKGYPDNSFRPQAYASRAEAATIIAKVPATNLFGYTH